MEGGPEAEAEEVLVVQGSGQTSDVVCHYLTLTPNEILWTIIPTPPPPEPDLCMTTTANRHDVFFA